MTLGNYAEYDASQSNDSALQWIDIQLFEEADLSADERREIISPIEEQIRARFGSVMNDAMLTAFRDDPETAAVYATGALVAHTDCDHVPGEYRDDVEEMLNRRMKQKRPALESMFDELIHDALRRAKTIPEDDIVNWGPVV